MIRLHQSANFSFDNPRGSLDEQLLDKEMNKKPILQEGNTSGSENLCCRICLSEEEKPEHILINPCKCGGSMKYIGLSCLKEWLQGKRHSKETDVVNSYIWKQLECEICKEPFKDVVMTEEGTEFDLLNYKIHDGS